ncbi:helix-turn-helix transcriptional regulator [Paenibacillus cymbidii]|uniref:helix-turn-helix transcriptional regulator n=1 Tax=Paenibacillus cymbidii TaxID=1639034 RepID=UPI001081ACE2|nr:AraC family transcriptional regulator [Paenibacillus cymbidii]
MLDLGLQMHRIVKLKYNSGYYIERHSHHFFHYIYVLDGIGQIVVNDATYNVAKGELYLIPIHADHEIHSLESLTTINFKFTCGHSFASKLNNLKYRVNDLTPHEDNIIKDVLNEALCAYEYSQELINIRFTELLLNMLRRETAAESAKARHSLDTHWNRNAASDELGEVMRYIHANCGKVIHIDELAGIAGYSESYFCTLFKRSFGTSPVQYINHMKVQKAKELMLHSETNITRLAKTLGFENIHYFSRLFKKITHVSPQEYMQKLQGDIVINVINDSVYIPKSRYESPQKRRADIGS